MIDPHDFTEEELAAAEEPVNVPDLVAFGLAVAVVVALVWLLAGGGWPA